MIPRILAWLLMLLAAAPAGAQQKYLIRGSSASIHGLANRLGLTVVREAQAGPHSLALLSDTAERPSLQVLNTARTAPEASALSSLELDGAVALPESSSATLNQSTVAILDTLRNRTVVPFFGAPAWASYLSQPASDIINLPEARRFGTGSRQASVAVIDTGVDPRHPLLRNWLVPGYDFVNDRPGIPSEWADLDQSTVAILDNYSGPSVQQGAAFVNQSTVAILDQSTVAILDRFKRSLPSCFGHGTMVSGLVHLVAPTAAIMPIKVFKADGVASLYDVVRAIYFAVDAGATVINMSFSTDIASEQLQAAVAYAYSKKVICIASAGNSGLRTIVYPAGWRRVDGIGSTNNRDRRSSFSNYGDELVMLAAPGEGLVTLYPGGHYAIVSGTSFSTALVSGGSAILKQINPGANQNQTNAALSEAKFIGQELGAGRLDLFTACQYAAQH